MTAQEYNSIDNTFQLIEDRQLEMCKNNNIRYYDYRGTFVILLLEYHKYKELITKIKELDYSDCLLVRATLNKSFFGTKEKELHIANSKLEKCKLDLYQWLDKTETPYLFLLQPIFSYGSGIDYNSYFVKRSGYLKVDNTGIDNLDIACDYANYLIKNKTL